jgi:branched-chain amino acid transport system ATP-binding protein
MNVADGAVLRTHRLTKRFGGLIAIDDVNLAITRGELHAVIGPNGAGKTTLISQLAGQLRPSSGRIFFNGRDVTALPTYTRARLGLGRSYQITSVFFDFTALDNVAFAAQVRGGHSFRFWRSAARDKTLREPAYAALEQVGLKERAHIVASELSHGERRQLEIAMTLAIEPKILLLDEPMAGMGPDESAQMIELIGSLKQKYTIILVEHDMSAVFALADRISVLVYGRIAATGDPAAIRADPAVQSAYLGTG